MTSIPSTALADAERIEAENEDLRRELAELEAALGGERETYLTTLEEQASSLRRENRVLEEAIERRPRPGNGPTSQQDAFFVLGILGLLAAGAGAGYLVTHLLSE